MCGKSGHPLDFIDRTLSKRQQHQQLRSLQNLTPIDAITVAKQGKSFLNFSSNDYLGLAKHPDLIAAAQTYAQTYGVGATASRLISGTYDIHQALEQQLARACGREAALLFNTGFQANATILSTLLDRQSLVLADRAIHNSLIQGILASKAKLIRFHHNDLNHLETLLTHQSQANPSRIVIVSETVFSMDGDVADVEHLIALKNQYQTLLYLDDAHGVGVLGPQGMGLAAFRPEIDIVVGTFGKALGSFGAFVTCSAKMRTYLLNTCPGFIYTTALPPPIIGAITAALQLMPHLEPARQTLQHQGENLRQQLLTLNYQTGASASHIIPIILGPESHALNLAQWLETQGILVSAIRPPTVAPGSARIRLALSAQHQVHHYQALIDAIGQWSVRPKSLP
jgi:8-amino-7-oxononanoate synthase